VTCSRCSEPSAYFSSTGDPLCRRCFNADETLAQDVRAIESEEGLESTGEASTLPRRLFWGGVGLCVLGVSLLGLAAFVGSRRGIAASLVMVFAGGRMISRSKHRLGA
jgi:hypothetical protein